MIMNEEIKVNNKIERKIYSRNDMLRYFYCPKEVPVYLKEFPLNDDVNEEWHKKPLPKFEEISDSKHKTTLTTNKFKERQRTISNQSSDVMESDFNGKFRGPNIHSSAKPKNDKFNRFNPLNESQINTSTYNEVPGTDSDWQTVESKAYKVSNLSKQYVSNYQGQENHWKKWSNNSTFVGDKNKQAPPFTRNEKTNNFVVRKADVENKSDITKLHSSQSFSMGTGQTEDIWQDDWDTEFQSQIATTSQECLDGYELPPSSIAVTNTTEMHCPMTILSNDDESISSSSDFDLWFYIDLSNEVQGPFPSQSMANWLATGYFDSSTKLRRQCDERFLLLAEYRALYGRIPFTSGVTIAPILKSTKVEIDPIQLTVGVDHSILQKVLTNATCLSSKMSKFVANIPMSHDVESSVINDNEKLALLEEKRKLEESKAELDKERKRMVEEQEQWKIRMEKEMESRMQTLILQQNLEMNKSINYLSTSTNNATVTLKDETIVLPEVKEDILQYQINLESYVGDGIQVDDWHSMRDLKGNKKNKKSKNKPMKLPLEPTNVPSSEAKTEIEKPSGVIKESGSIRIVQQEIMDELKHNVKGIESPKTESSVSWNNKPTVMSIEPPKATKSLLEIQAEEAESEKTKREIERALNLSKIEVPKITSFKESLLKSVVPLKTPTIPTGKSIWDLPVCDSAEVVTTPIIDKDVPEKKLDTKEKKKKTPKRPSDNYEKNLLSDNNNDGLLDWCGSKLSKFNRDLDVFTVVELLKEVPNENVPELTLELLDDSIFSRNFARDFVKKRQELLSSPATQAGGPGNEDNQWQTVKKQSAAVGDNKTKNAVSGSGGKTKTKKKMVVIDHTKFRSC